MDPYKTHDIYFDFKNSQFKKNLIAHHHTIKDKRIILFMKHLYLRKIINVFQVSIIVASTIITFFESMKPHIFTRDHDKNTQAISICLSTYIAISTAIFKFIKIDDRKEEIYKMLQIFNEVESLLNHKLKQIRLIQSHFDDEMMFYTKNRFTCDVIKKEPNPDESEEDYDSEEEEKEDYDPYVDLAHHPLSCEDKDNMKKIMHKHYDSFYKLIQLYEQEDVENKMLSAKKEFHTMFSYNEIIHYKGKIVESMLLEKVHTGNRSILEAPIEEYKNQFNMIRSYQNDISNSDISNEIQSLQQNIVRSKQANIQIYNEDEFLYGSSWCNNICLYFSNSCHFCLVMNLYLSLAIKRAKFRALKTKFDKEQKNKEEPLEYVCCHCKGVDSMLEWCCYKKEDEENQNVVYFCCDC
jgi:hypothetical protein